MTSDTVSGLLGRVERDMTAGLLLAAEIADAVADEKDVLALSSDESNVAAYREGERTANQIAALLRALSASTVGE